MMVDVLTLFKHMYLHISNICINLAEQLRDITNQKLRDMRKGQKRVYWKIYFCMKDGRTELAVTLPNKISTKRYLREFQLAGLAKGVIKSLKIVRCRCLCPPYLWTNETIGYTDITDFATPNYIEF